MVIGFAEHVYRRLIRRDPNSTSDDHKKKETAEISTRPSGGYLSTSDSGTIATGAPSDDFFVENGEKKDSNLDRADAKDGALNPKEENQNLGPATRRRTMSRQKFEAVAASVALKARNELVEKRNRRYAKAISPLRIGFEDCENLDTDGESFAEDFGKFLNEEQKDQERNIRERDHKWFHSFLEYSSHKKKKKRMQKTKKQTKQPDGVSSPSEKVRRTNVLNVRSLHREYMSFGKNLPVSPEGAIFVRVPEHRLDLPRVLITGPHGTPYANGLFFFDLWTNDYPNSPPKVQFLTTGMGTVRFNPNLYASGKVCLSLLGTWHGPGWHPGVSNLLQVLLSCQGLVLGTDEPFFNEPGYEHYKGGKQYKRESNRYNRNIRKQTLRWGILDPLQQIVMQEEHVEKRRQFLTKLQEQRQKKEESSIEASGSDDDGDTNSSSDCPSPLAPNDTASSDKDDIRVKKKKKRKKRKWLPISKLWSSSSNSAKLQNGKSKQLLPSDIPPRRTIDYPEFTEVMIRHFVEVADQIEEQLQSWHELDPKGTKKEVERIRHWMKRLFALVERRKLADEEKVSDEDKSDGI